MSVVIDTLNRAAVGADENASGDMGRVIESAKQLQQRLGGLVLLVHHSGKDHTKGLRGHSSLYAALDAVIEVTRTSEQRSWKVEKLKDGCDGEEHSFSLSPVDLGTDEYGEQMSSCVVLPGDIGGAKRPRKPPTGKNQRLVLTAVRDIISQSGERMPGTSSIPAGIKAVKVEEVIARARHLLVTDEKRKPERIREAIQSLAETDYVGLSDPYVWLI
jgi:putative DNA primase/helicase